MPWHHDGSANLALRITFAPSHRTNRRVADAAARGRRSRLQLGPAAASPRALLGVNRDHWRIEIMHRNSDVILGEDGFTDRCDSAPRKTSLPSPASILKILKSVAPAPTRPSSTFQDARTAEDEECRAARRPKTLHQRRSSPHRAPAAVVASRWNRPRAVLRLATRCARPTRPVRVQPRIRLDDGNRDLITPPRRTRMTACRQGSLGARRLSAVVARRGDRGELHRHRVTCCAPPVSILCALRTTAHHYL